MNQMDIDRIKGQIKSKIRKGDYVTLSQMLGVNQDTARTQFRRDKPPAVLAMKQIIISREEMIESYKPQKEKEDNT